jgi:autotransporter-associated beta strand protein
MVVSNTGGSTLQVGADNTDFTFAGVVSGAGGQQPNLSKIGTGTMHLTGANTSTGNLTVYGGTVVLDGAGTSLFGTAQFAKGGTLTVDDSASVVANRLGTKNLTGLGGTFRMLGGAAAATETVTTLNSGGGGTANQLGGGGFIQVEPAGTPAATTLLFTNVANFNNANATNTYVFRGASLGALPGAPAAATTGLIAATNANLTANNATNQNGAMNSLISGSVGSPSWACGPTSSAIPASPAPAPASSPRTARAPASASSPPPNTGPPRSPPTRTPAIGSTANFLTSGATQLLR